MNTYKISVLLILCVIHTELGLAQIHTDIEGDVKIRGLMDASHPDDDTSIYLGRDAGINIRAVPNLHNSFFGTAAGRLNTLGSQNSFFGLSAGRDNTSGSQNSFFGALSGLNNTTGRQNSFFGLRAGEKNITGRQNSFFGLRAGEKNTTGSFNSFLGSYAGRHNTTGTNNTFIGGEAGQLAVVDSLDRAIAIGYQAKVNCSNCAVIGGIGVNKVNLGINTADPVSQITIKQSTGGDNSGIRLISNASDHSWEIRNTSGTDNLRIRAFDSSSMIEHTVEIRRSDGAYLQNSDARLKRDIVYFDNIISDIIKIKPATYYWNNQPRQSIPSLGVIAQELEALFPTAVSADEDGYKMVNYDALGVLAIQAIKEQHAVIQKLESEITQLNQSNRKLNNRMKVIENMLNK